jgi:hypothetical protein
MAVETSDYGKQGNRNSDSIGVYFCFCRDECLRLWADLNRLLDSGSDCDDWRDRRDVDDRRDHCDVDDWRHDRDFDDWHIRRGFADWRDHRNFAANLVLGHQLQ